MADNVFNDHMKALIQAGTEQGIASSNQGAAAQRGAAENQYAQQQAKLANYLKGQSEDTKRKAEEDQVMRVYGGKTIQEAVSNMPEGASLKIGDIAVGADPTTRLLNQQMKGAAGDIGKAQALYNKGAPKIQEQLNSTGELLQGVNNPKNMMSLGQAKTLMLKSMGMNRYNQQEANALIPNTFQNTVGQMFNRAGGEDSPLSPNEQRALNEFALGHVGRLKTTHETLKQNALNSYQSSPYFDQGRAATLQQNMGGPLAGQIEGLQGQYKNAPTTQHAPDEQAALPGMVDKLKGFFTGGKSAAPQGGVPSGQVKLQSPDGRTGFATPEKAKALVAKGYKQVQ